MYDHYVVVMPEDFDDIFRGDALIANLKTPKAEKAYEEKDQKLINLIKDVVPEKLRDDIYIGQDWWPDHTRHLEICATHCTFDFLSSLQRLLKSDFSSYRIQLCVYKNLSDGNSYIGSIVLYVNRRLVEKPLYNYLFEKKKETDNGASP